MRIDLRLRKENARTGDTGFTMIEVLVVIGLSAILGGFALLISMDQYRDTGFRSDRDMLIALLERARAESINNVCLGSDCTDGRPHGVTRVGDSYILFQGTTYDTRDVAADATFEASDLVSYNATAQTAFSQLSGTTTGSVITLTDQSGRASEITVGTEGQISWTH